MNTQLTSLMISLGDFGKMCLPQPFGEGGGGHPANTKSCSLGLQHSRPQSLRSFWSVIGIESSGLVQHRKSAIHGLPVKSSKSDCMVDNAKLILCACSENRVQSELSIPTTGQIKRIVGSGDENGITAYILDIRHVYYF